MVADSFGNGMPIDYNYEIIHIHLYIGQPVAWCISNHEDTSVMTIFLQSVQDRSPDTPIMVLMTDDGKLGLYNHILCIHKI